MHRRKAREAAAREKIEHDALKAVSVSVSVSAFVSVPVPVF